VKQDCAKDSALSVVSLDEDKKQNAKRMKTSHYFAMLLIALAPSVALCQAQPAPNSILAGMPVPGARPITEEPKLSKFNLDFPGGTPKQLVAAIEKAMAKPLNAIIPDKDAEVKLPALKLNNVNVRDLFQALEQSSLKSESYPISTPGGYQYSTYRSHYSFSTQGPISDDSIWYFLVDTVRPPVFEPIKSCRFYALSPYLERGLTVDDITTAIKTGWKMQGDTNTPAISFHPETKLLIAVGEQSKLETIDAVLKALTPPPGSLAPTAFPAAVPPLGERLGAKPAEKKAEK
jgi:hypothetical protein